MLLKLAPRVLLLGLVVLLQGLPAQEGLQKPKDASPAPAMDKDEAKEGGKAGHGTFEFRLGYYDNEDSPADGNPFLDEDLTVIEPVFYLDYNTTDTRSYWGKVSYDQVSSASIDRLNTYPGTEQSGATGDYYLGVDLGYRNKDSDSTRHGAWVHLSAEYDYRSIGFGGSRTWDAADKNSTTKWSGNLFYDDLDLILFNGKEAGSDHRLSISTELTRYQVIDKRTHGQYGATLTYQDGFLGTPYNAVVLEDGTLPPNPLLFNMARGTEVSERLPDTRIRFALHGKVRRHFGTGTALEAGGRIYADDWGVTSITIEPRMYHWLVEDCLRMRLRYRYYMQSEADDFRARFVPLDNARRYLTQDADLGDFDSHTLGLRLAWLYSDSTTLDLTADHVTRDDGIDQIIASIAASWRF